MLGDSGRKRARPKVRNSDSSLLQEIELGPGNKRREVERRREGDREACERQ